MRKKVEKVELKALGTKMKNSVNGCHSRADNRVKLPIQTVARKQKRDRRKDQGP